MRCFVALLYFLIVIIGGCIGIFYLTIKYLGNIAGVILGIFLVIIYAPIAFMIIFDFME